MSGRSDIVEELREMSTNLLKPYSQLAVEAADEIEVLRAECEACVGEIRHLAAELEKLRTKLADPVEVRRSATDPQGFSVSWDGYLVSGRKDSIDEVTRLIDFHAWRKPCAEEQP